MKSAPHTWAIDSASSHAFRRMLTPTCMDVARRTSVTSTAIAATVAGGTWSRNSGTSPTFSTMQASSPADSSLRASESANATSSSIVLSFCGAAGSAGMWIIPRIGLLPRSSRTRRILERSQARLTSRLYRAGHDPFDHQGGAMPTDQRMLSRRGLIGVLGGGVASVAFGARALDAFGAGNENLATCLLTPEATEGPYWIDTTLTRRDVREGRPGLPLVLELTILNARTCKPITGADVEIWHADAGGEYSGFDGGAAGGGGPAGPGGGSGPQTKTRYLRGHQRSDPLGKASFLTIF